MDAVIFDVDGTLCDVRTVRHHVRDGRRDFTAFHIASTACPPVAQTQAIWHALPAGIARIVVTARKRAFEQHTLWWLLLNGFEPDGLWLREDWDQRPDVEVKRDILQDIRRQFRPILAIDDNPAVVVLWEQQQIPVIQIPGWED